MNGIRRVLAVGLLCVVCATGCGPQATRPGTSGKLLISGQPVGEILMHVYRMEAGKSVRVGFGETKSDGSFHLFTNEARGPLVLVPGDYVVTLESSGTPLVIPPEFQKPESTSLKKTWSTTDSKLDLSAAIPLPP